jgi:hypothetical protein
MNELDAKLKRAAATAASNSCVELAEMEMELQQAAQLKRYQELVAALQGFGATQSATESIEQFNLRRARCSTQIARDPRVEIYKSQIANLSCKADSAEGTAIHILQHALAGNDDRVLSLWQSLERDPLPRNIRLPTAPGRRAKCIRLRDDDPALEFCPVHVTAALINLGTRLDPTAAALVQRRIDEDRSLIDLVGGTATRVGTTSNQAPVQRNPNLDARDKWIYEECMSVVKYEEIIRRLRDDHDEWESIDSINGIKSAAKKYAERRGLSGIPVRQAGRPKKK